MEIDDNNPAGSHGLSGFILLAAPEMKDPNFHQSAVLIVDHSEEGAMGLILNRPTTIRFEDVAAQLRLRHSARRLKNYVFAGGPVEPASAWLLHEKTFAGEVAKEVIKDVYFSADLDAMKRVLTRSEGSCLFCLGYAGWGPEQLDSEVKAGSWLILPAHRDFVYADQPGETWRRGLASLGIDPALYVPNTSIH